MHQVLAAELGTLVDERVHHVDGSLAHAIVARADGEAGRLDEQPVQSGDGDARVFRRAARRGELRGAHAVRLIGERIRRDLEPVVAELGGVLALLGKRHRGDDFVAERDAHAAPVSKLLVAPGLLPVAAEEVRDAAVALEELVRHLEHGEENAALGPRPGFVPAAGRAPDELAGLALAFRADQAALEHIGLLDLDVLMVRQVRARRHPHERGEQAALLIHQERLLLDARVSSLLPRHTLDVQKVRSKLGSAVHGLVCSPTLTIFMVLVPPLLPIGSPMVRTMMSPSFTTLFCKSAFSASRKSSSRSWPTYLIISGNTSRKSAQR